MRIGGAQEVCPSASAMLELQAWASGSEDDSFVRTTLAWGCRHTQPHTHTHTDTHTRTHTDTQTHTDTDTHTWTQRHEQKAFASVHPVACIWFLGALQSTPLPPLNLEDTMMLIVNVLKVKYVPEFLAQVRHAFAICHGIAFRCTSTTNHEDRCTQHARAHASESKQPSSPSLPSTHHLV